MISLGQHTLQGGHTLFLPGVAVGMLFVRLLAVGIDLGFILGCSQSGCFNKTRIVHETRLVNNPGYVSLFRPLQIGAFHLGLLCMMSQYMITQYKG